MNSDYEQSGIPKEPAAVRVDRMEEAIAVLKGCFADGPFSFEGRYYRITDHDGGPKPVQRPHPPFLVGGGGRKTLTLAAREAQIVGLAPRVRRSRDNHSLTLEATVEKIGWVRDAAGDRFDELTLNVYPTAIAPIVTDHAHQEARQVADLLAERGDSRLTEDEILASPHLFIGSLDALEEKILRLRAELGISSIMVGELGPLDPIVERLAGR
jgi:alkanesulfonate monooxygenase SsuD/methylene tetrahydromethanopterin reductase-like flavin-dependent oxidoreductase (luciferase family)